ncbi:MAG: hypothetical protein ACKV22_40040 [Bryobacteraceae bacterium]
MYIRQHSLGAPRSHPFRLPNVEALDAKRAEMERNCQGVTVVEWLQKDGPKSLREHIDQLERRLIATPRLVEGHEKRRRVRGEFNKELEKLRRDPLLRNDPFARSALRRRIMDSERDVVTEYPELAMFRFPKGYVVRSAADELAKVRCQLSRARLNFLTWDLTKQRPQGVGFLRLGETPSPLERSLTRAFDRQLPNRPLSLWTIRGFQPNAAALGAAQLSEIELIAGGIARNPRTKSGMPVMTITGGFTRGENANVGNSRAAAVREALKKALQRLDPNLLMSVGLDIAEAVETSQPEVSISLRELIPPPPNLRISPQSPLVQPNPLAPRGTPLPPAPPAARSPSGRSVEDLFRTRVEGILRRFGVKNPAVRKAIADSAVYQTEEALRAAVGQAEVSGEIREAIVESIRALGRGRPR